MAKVNYLIWTGGPGVCVPGWPASDHEEPDAKLYAEKLASKLYRTPDAKEDQTLTKEAEAAKLIANTKAAEGAAHAEAQAKAEAKAANEEHARKEADLKARLAAAKQTLKEVDDGGEG